MYINKAENEYCNSGYKYRGSDKTIKTFCCISVLQTLGTIEAALFIAYLGIFSKLGFLEFS